MEENKQLDIDKIVERHTSTEIKHSSFGRGQSYEFKFLYPSNAKDAMEEYATSKLHLLQQEYNDLKGQHESLEKQAVKQNDILFELQQAYDKLKGENERLTQWKKEASLVLNPILDYGQFHRDIKLGSSITTFVIDRCKDYDNLYSQYNTLKDENDLLKAELNDSLNILKDIRNLLFKSQAEHAALKATAKKMADCLTGIMLPNNPNPITDSELIEDFKDALSHYNSQTNNQNENNENRD